MKLLLILTLLFNFAFASMNTKEFNQLKQTYIKNFKDKYEAKYTKRVNVLPRGLQELLLNCYKKAFTYLKNPTLKQKHKLVKNLYVFFENYQKQNGKAEYYAHKIGRDTPVLKNTQLLKNIIQLGIESDNVIKERIKQLDEKDKQLDEEIKQGEERIKKWDEILGTLRKISK